MMLKSCVLLGKYPQLDIEITFVPVDFVSQAMVQLAAKEWSFGRAFHFFNPAPIEWQRLIDIFRSSGYPMDALPYEQWRRELHQRKLDGPPAMRSLLGVTALALSAPHFLFYKRPPLDASQTLAGLQGTAIACPPIDEALIKTYIRFWQGSGYLSVPSLP
jgi:thioester reductase-like protein